MSYLTNQEKLKKVFELCEQLHITAYEIGENTPLNTSGVHRILSKEQSPRGKTIDILYNYVMKRKKEATTTKSNTGGDPAEQLGEPEIPYGTSIQEVVARQVYKTLEPLLSDLHSQQQIINRMLIKNSLNMDDMKDELEAIQQKTDFIKSSVAEMHQVLNPKK